MNKEIQGFIFDIGQVLVRWDSRYIWQKIITEEDELQEQLVFFRPFMYLGDAGVSYPMMIQILSAIYPERAVQFQFWWQHWEAAFVGEIAGTVAIVRQLKKLGYPLYILSNFSLETMARVEERIPCLRLFDDKILSGAEGLVKPQKEIFQLGIERFGLQGRAGHCLFIDDLQANIAAAQAVGLQGHVFESPEKLAKDLAGRNILPLASG